MTKYIVLFILFSNTFFAFSQGVDDNLLMAADSGNVKEVLSLIRRGADVNTQNYEGVTPLMFAADKGYLDVVEVLVEKGADVNMSPDNGITALMAAVKSGHLQVADFLIKHKSEIEALDINGINSLLYACSNGDLDITDMLLYYKAIPTSTDSKGNTVMHIAAYRGDTAMIRLLLEYGLNTEYIDNQGFTPLHYAAQKGYIEVAEILLANKAKINAISKKNITPLTVAVQNCKVEMCNYLIQNGADVNHKVTGSLNVLGLSQMSNCNQLHDSLKKNGATTLISPYISQFFLGQTLNFNPKDIFWGVDLGVNEARYNTAFSLGFQVRPYKKFVLDEINSNEFYQYREKKHLFYIAARKKFEFSKDDLLKIGCYVGIKEAFVSGKYSGVATRPDFLILTLPQIGLYFEGKFSSFNLHYEYMDLKTIGLSPHRIEVSWSTHLDIGKYSAAGRKIEWMD